MPEIRVRFAPSPTGFLHVGGARTALFNWLFARHHQGKFILRIEDTDAGRSSAAMVEGILQGMRWLGLDWDEGPVFQSQRLEHYRAEASRLKEAGSAYPCFCSVESLAAKREAAAKAKVPWKYDGTCRSLMAAEIRERALNNQGSVLRFKVPSEGKIEFSDRVFGPIEHDLAAIEDFVLLRSDGMPTYHLSVVVDDVDMQISHVIRGADHISNTPKQVLLYQALNAQVPEFAHVPLILGPDKSRLSKRHGATSVTAYRDQGFLPEAFRNFLALLGWSPGDDTERMSTAELIERFSLEGINKSNAVFNLEKLAWLNSQYLSSLPAQDLLPLVEREMEGAGLWDAAYQGERRAWFLGLIDLLKTRARLLPDFVSNGRAFLSDAYEIDPSAREKFLKEPSLAVLLPDLAARLEALPEFTIETAEATLRSFAEERQVKPGLLINASRVLLTGKAVAPGIFEVMAMLGQSKTTHRLRRASWEVGGAELGGKSAPPIGHSS
ncbi:MAG: glutamate--tRNA ligase [Acidimicrobiia bacterium]|nr:glutamate--tRNA ligase [Acidimicrobiia bacterium]